MTRQISLDPTSLGLKEGSFEDCQRQLSETLSEHTKAVKATPEMARLVREQFLGPASEAVGLKT